MCITHAINTYNLQCNVINKMCIKHINILHIKFLAPKHCHHLFVLINFKCTFNYHYDYFNIFYYKILKSRTVCTVSIFHLFVYRTISIQTYIQVTYVCIYL